MVNRCLITHSLLQSWLWAIKENPYEDMTSERDPMAEFMQVLRREPTTPTEAMLNGNRFEQAVTDVLAGRGYAGEWLDVVGKVAGMLHGSVLQYKANKVIEVSGVSVVLHGRLDALRAGTIFDTKFSKGYDRGKYINSTQHPAYFELVPEAGQFVYIISNGIDVWTEEYRREETPSIRPTIADFFSWLDAQGLTETYRQYWGAR